MSLRRVFLIFPVLLFFYTLSFAGKLISPEAVNYFNEGVKAQKAANYAATEINYQKALLLDPYNLNLQKFIINNRGIIYAQGGELDRAEAAFNEALRIDPKYKSAQLNLGFIYELRRSRLESLEYWLKVLNINLDEIKPRDFVIEEQQKVEETK